MDLSLPQIKAVLRATPISERLNILTDIFLELNDEYAERFCENYRWVLGSQDRKQQVANNRKQKTIINCSNKKESNEVYGKKGE